MSVNDLHVGDKIWCSGADGAIKIKNRLAKKGYQTDFIFDHDNDRIGLEITEIINGITTIADGLKAQMERH